MSDSHAQNHPYHLVDPSPWPAFGSFAVLVLTVGAVLFFHNEPVFGLDIGYLKVAVGLLLVVATMYFWWKDVVRESVAGHYHTEAVNHGLRVGVLLFIVSEVMFFAAFFWAFFHSSLGFSTTVTQWPPEGVQTFNPWTLPFYNTLILLTSGATVTWAHHELIHGTRDRFLTGLWCTVALGVLFLGLQAYEYSHAAFGFRDGIYSSTFYMATGFHGMHVFVGTVFLAVCALRAHRGHFSVNKHVGFEAAAWYWHFVDVVWLFLFVWVYWWGR